MTASAPAEVRREPVSGPGLAMACWWCGPFWFALLMLLMAGDVVHDKFDGLCVSLPGIPSHVGSLALAVAVIGYGPSRRSLEGRCVLCYWALVAGLVVFASARTDGHDWLPPNWRPPGWLAPVLACAFLASVGLPPLRYTIRCRVASDRPRGLVTAWLAVASCSAIWLGLLVFHGASDLAPAAWLGLAFPFPWLLHGIAILLLALGTVHWTLVRSAIGCAVVGYWLSLVLLAKGVTGSPTADTALLSAMVVLGLFVPMSLLPRWCKSAGTGIPRPL